MHYIIGTQIQISERTVSRVKPGMTGAQIRSMSTRSTSFSEQKEKLDPGTIYTLSRISKIEEDYNYKFTGGGDVRELTFRSISEAESFISEIRSEQVPDYSNVYNNMTD